MKIRCPKCGVSLHIGQEVLGKMGRCPKCRHQFRLSEAPAAPPAETAATQAGDESADLYKLAEMAEMERSSPAAPDPQSAVAADMPSRPVSPQVPSRIPPVATPRQAPKAPRVGLVNVGALRIASLILCVALPLSWLLPWATVTSDIGKLIQIRIDGKNPLQNSSTSTGLSLAWHEGAAPIEGDTSTVLTLAGLVMFGVGAIAAGAVALLSIRAGQLSRTWPPAATALLGILLFLMGTKTSSGRMFHISATSLVYVVLLAAAAATLLALLQVDWSKLTSRTQAAPAAPSRAKPTAFRQSFGGDPARAEGTSYSPLTVAAGLIALLPLISWYLPWSQKVSVPGAAFAMVWPNLPDVPQAQRDQLGDKWDKIEKAITGAKVAVFGSRAFGAGAFAAAIVGVVLLSLGSGNFRFAGAGGLITCLGMLIFLIGVLYAASQFPGADGKSGFGWGFYAAGICSLGCAISGFMAQKP